MFVSTPNDSNPLFQEYAWHKWMRDTEGYSKERSEALDSISRIIEHQYEGQGCVIGRLISEYDMMIYDFAWEPDDGEAMCQAIDKRLSEGRTNDPELDEVAA